MTAGAKTIIYPVTDLDAAKTVFRALLGADPVLDQPYYVQFAAGGQEVGLDPNGHRKGMTAAVNYWHVDDIKATVAALLAAGAQEVQAVTDVGGGRLIASVKDANGNVVGVLQPSS